MRTKLITSVLVLLLGFSAFKNYEYIKETKEARSQLSSLQKENTKQSVIITRYIAPDSTKHVIYTEALAKTEPEKYQATGGYIDSLKRALNVKVEQIAEMTRIKATVKDKVKTTVTDSIGYQTFSYKNKWLDAKLTTKDSLLNYTYNVELVDTKYYRGNWLMGKTWYRDISLADPNGFINGVQRFSLPPDHPKRLGLGLQIGYHYNVVTRQAEPSVGLGLSYNFIRF